MHLRTLVPSMAVLAAATPFACGAGLELEDGSISLKFSASVQSRLEVISAKDQAGDDYDIWEHRSYPDTTEEGPELVNFMIRRLRFGISGTYKEDLAYKLELDGDLLGARTNGDCRDNGSAIRTAYLAYTWHQTEDLEHSVEFGRNQRGLVNAVAGSTNKLLFPTYRLTSVYDIHGYGLGLVYRLRMPVLKVDVNITEREQLYEDNNDWAVSARVATGLSKDWALQDDQTETWLGKEGFEHEAGLGIGFTTDDNGDNDSSLLVSADYRIHYDALSAAFDIAWLNREIQGTDDAADGIILSAQAGWALVLESMVIEPALRLSYVDNDMDDDYDGACVYQDEGGASGVYVDVGANLYLDGHANKFQAAVTFYTPEEDDGRAFIFRLQHQLSF